MVLHLAAFLVVVLLSAGDAAVRFLGLSGSSAFGSLRVWQLVTYPMVYVSPQAAMMLISVVLVLLFLGSKLEREWGALRFVLFYVVMAAATGLVRLLGGDAPVIGSLGVIYGFLGAYALVFRNERLWLIFAVVRVLYAVIGLVIILILMNIGDLRNLLWAAGVPLGYLYARTAIRRESRRARAPRPEKDRFSQLDI